VINFHTGWQYNRWYSNNAISKMVSGLAVRAWGRSRLASLIVEQHRVRPYDVIYQFSTIELFGMRRHLPDLPPLVVHPETHMAGELHWLRRERHLAAKCEPRWRRTLAALLIAARARRQMRDIVLADWVVAVSSRFGEHLVADYGVNPDKMTVVPNPIDLAELVPRDMRLQNEKLRIVFISRMSSRKGVELIVELSHRLADLAGEIDLHLIGAETLWSDYRPLLGGLDRRVAQFHGAMARVDLARFLGAADLLIQPAKYEPFGLTVGEALACGLPVVASEEVGATEGVASECCITVPAGDVNSLEQAVRKMLMRLTSERAPNIRATARLEAERLFAPDKVAQQLKATLQRVVIETRCSGAPEAPTVHRAFDRTTTS